MYQENYWRMKHVLLNHKMNCIQSSMDLITMLLGVLQSGHAFSLIL